MRIVVDASVAAAWYLPDEQNIFADRVLSSLPKFGALAPVLFKIEIANALTLAVRRGRISAEYRAGALDRLKRLKFEFDVKCLETVWQSVPDIADQYKLTIYDAMYLDVAHRRGLELATLDEQLAQAARQAGVTLFEAAS